jgi:hypothetical protein
MRRRQASTVARRSQTRPARFAVAFAWVVALLAPVTAMVPALPAAAAPAAPDRVTFGLAPASATGPDGRPALDYAVSPGEVIYDHVAALNYSDQPLSLQLYASDAVETNLGGFGLALPTQKQTGVGSWIALPPQDANVQVPARSAQGPGTVVVPLTLTVPSNAPPGDHAGGVLVSLSTTGRNRSGEVITLDQRTGTRVLLTVSGTLTPQLSLTNVHASYAGTFNPVGSGVVHVTYTVHNTGNVDLAVGLKSSVSGLLGASAVTRLPGVAILLPGASVTGVAQVRGVWPEIVAHASVTATARTVATGKSVALAPVTTSKTVWTVPWVLLIILLVVIAGLVYYRRRREKHPAKSPAHAAGPPSTPKRDAKVEVTA